MVVPDCTRLKYNAFVSLPNEIFNGPALYMIKKKASNRFHKSRSRLCAGQRTVYEYYCIIHKDDPSSPPDSHTLQWHTSLLDARVQLVIISSHEICTDFSFKDSAKYISATFNQKTWKTAHVARAISFLFQEVALRTLPHSSQTPSVCIFGKQAVDVCVCGIVPNVNSHMLIDNMNYFTGFESIWIVCRRTLTVCGLLVNASV